jgi:hypothetical protein
MLNLPCVFEGKKKESRAAGRLAATLQQLSSGTKILKRREAEEGN